MPLTPKLGRSFPCPSYPSCSRTRQRSDFVPETTATMPTWVGGYLVRAQAPAKIKVEADKQLLEAMRVKILQSKTNLWIKRRWVEAWSNTRLLDAPSHVPFVIQLLQMNANDVFPLRLWVLLQVLQPCEIDSNIIKQHRAILCVGRKSLHAAYTPQVALHPSVHTSHCNLATYWTMAPDERSNFFLHEKNIQLKPDTSWHLSNWVYPGNPFVGLVRIPLTWIVP